MTMKDKLEWIDKEAYCTFAGMQFRVRVLDYKFSYGHDRWLVKPIRGDGQAWVEKIDPVL